MIECFYLQADEQMPAMADEEAWLLIEASNDGRFFGTGYSFNASGEGVFYASRLEDDTTLKGALAAAKEWTESRGVPRIWVQLSPHFVSVRSPPIADVRICVIRSSGRRARGSR